MQLKDKWKRRFNFKCSPGKFRKSYKNPPTLCLTIHCLPLACSCVLSLTLFTYFHSTTYVKLRCKTFKKDSARVEAHINDTQAQCYVSTYIQPVLGLMFLWACFVDQDQSFRYWFSAFYVSDSTTVTCLFRPNCSSRCIV